MEVKVTIDGEGYVTGGGTHSLGDSVTVKATPVEGVEFSHWIRNNITVTSNPYTFTVNDNYNIELTAVFFTTIESYLRAAVGFSVPDAALTKIRIDRGIKLHENIVNVSTQKRELAYADLLMWGGNSPSEVQGAKESDFGWSHQDASSTMSITDKRMMRLEAKSIYKKYGDKMLPPTVSLFSLFGSKINGSKY